MNIPNQLPIVRIDRASFYVDKRLMELRHVDNPHDRIELAEFYACLSTGDLIHIEGDDYESASFHSKREAHE